MSTDTEYTFSVDHNVKLVAYFSPNTDEESILSIDKITTNTQVSVIQEGNEIIAHSAATINSITLYTIDAIKVASENSNKINIQNINEGVYIVRVATEKGCKNVKLYIGK